MTVLRLLSACAILGMCVLLSVDLRRRRGSWSGAWLLLRERLHQGIGVILRRRGTAGTLERVRHAVYVITLGLSLVLMLTGFVPLVVLGQHMTGVLLVVHVSVAPLFALGLAAAAILWSRRHEFGRHDWGIVLRVWSRRSFTLQEVAPFLLKKWYWLVLLLSLPLVLTVILEMFPLFGTEGEELLIRIHAYSALALAITVMLHTYLVVLYGGARNQNLTGDAR